MADLYGSPYRSKTPFGDYWQKQQLIGSNLSQRFPFQDMSSLIRNSFSFAPISSPYAEFGGFSSPTRGFVDGMGSFTQKSLARFPLYDILAPRPTQKQSSSSSSQNNIGTTGPVNLPNSIKPWSTTIASASKKLGVPEDVIGAIMMIESNGDPYAVSSAGAIGLMQVMPFHSDKTAAYGGGSLDDPYTNIMVGSQILRDNYQLAKQKYTQMSEDELWNVAAAAYLGDWDWSSGTYAGSSDAYGTDGPAYVQKFNTFRNQIRSQGSGAPGDKQSLWGFFGGNNYTITQGYGLENTDPSLNQSFYHGNGHTGIDVAVPTGTALFSPWEGEVVTAGDMGGYGTAVYLKTAFGYVLLGHMSGVSVQSGQHISAGTLLGYSGNTGTSTGPHSHVEIRNGDGQSVDPSLYLAW